MKKEEYDKSIFWIGPEVEKTPAYGLRTLFVVGIQDPTILLDIAHRNDCTHIYFGANQTFPRLAVNDAKGWAPWENMIKCCLDADMWCTLDFDVSCVEGVLEAGFDEYHKFIASISVKLPYIKSFNYNATIKIDDKQFEGANPGIWCHRVHDLMNSQVFTDWSKYTHDEALDE